MRCSLFMMPGPRGSKLARARGAHALAVVGVDALQDVARSRRIRRQSEDGIQLRRPHVLARRQIEAEDAELGGLGRQPQLLAAFLGRRHGLAKLVDVGAGDEPGLDALAAAHHGEVQAMPAPGAGGVAQAQLQLEVLGVRNRLLGPPNARGEGPRHG